MAPGTPAAAFEHVESYLRAVFGFIGVTDLEIVVAEGLAIGPGAARKSDAGRLAGRHGIAAATLARAA